MNKLATGFAAALLTAGMSCAAIAGAGNSGDNGGGNAGGNGGGNAGGNGGGNAGGNGGGNAGGQSAGVGANGVGSNGMSRNDWTGGWSEYWGSAQVGNGKGLARRNYGLAVRVQAWRGTWGESLGGEGGQAQADGDMHRSERLQGYLDSHLGIGSQK